MRYDMMCAVSGTWYISMDTVIDILDKVMKDNPPEKRFLATLEEFSKVVKTAHK